MGHFQPSHMSAIALRRSAVQRIPTCGRGWTIIASEPWTCSPWARNDKTSKTWVRNVLGEEEREISVAPATLLPLQRRTKTQRSSGGGGGNGSGGGIFNFWRESNRWATLVNSIFVCPCKSLPCLNRTRMVPLHCLLLGSISPTSSSF